KWRSRKRRRRRRRKSRRSSRSKEAAVIQTKPHILIIITGGTICMDYGGELSSLRPQRLAQRLQQLPELRDSSLPNFDVLEWETLVDSSDISVAHWQRLATQIQQFYDPYDGFVILHGTDTLAYTASALSFMLENLAKPVVLTGSMLPMLHIATDAKRNLVASMLIAGCSELREVAVVFGAHVMRGCRVTKFDCAGFEAFASPNCPSLGMVGVDVIINEEALLLRQAASASAAALAAAAGPAAFRRGLPAAAAHASSSSPFPPSALSASGTRSGGENVNEEKQGGPDYAHAAAAGGYAAPPGGGEGARDGGLRVFSSMAENIVALPLTPFLPMRILQLLLSGEACAKKTRLLHETRAAAGEHQKLQQRGGEALEKREAADAAGSEREDGGEPGVCKTKIKGEAGEEGGHRSPLSVVLLLYGSGTAPGNPELLSTIQRGIERGVNIVILSQCRRGCANLLAYENGVRLHNLGVISGKDSTLEACVAKLSYLTVDHCDAHFSQAFQKSYRDLIAAAAASGQVRSNNRCQSRLGGKDVACCVAHLGPRIATVYPFCETSPTVCGEAKAIKCRIDELSWWSGATSNRTAPHGAGVRFLLRCACYIPTEMEDSNGDGFYHSTAEPERLGRYRRAGRRQLRKLSLTPSLTAQSFLVILRWIRNAHGGVYPANTRLSKSTHPEPGRPARACAACRPTPREALIRAGLRRDDGVSGRFRGCRLRVVRRKVTRVKEKSRAAPAEGHVLRVTDPAGTASALEQCGVDTPEERTAPRCKDQVFAAGNYAVSSRLAFATYETAEEAKTTIDALDGKEIFPVRRSRSVLEELCFRRSYFSRTLHTYACVLACANVLKYETGLTQWEKPPELENAARPASQQRSSIGMLGNSATRFGPPVSLGTIAVPLLLALAAAASCCCCWCCCSSLLLLLARAARWCSLLLLLLADGACCRMILPHVAACCCCCLLLLPAAATGCCYAAFLLLLLLLLLITASAIDCCCFASAGGECHQRHARLLCSWAVSSCTT
ncbi:unnamed protein product, partial [Rangifer tarandus platyrhynchus]